MSYRVILGANENTMTRVYRVDDGGRTETVLAEAHTPYILDCDNPRDFWVLYGYGFVIVGKGQKLFENLILDTQDVDMEPVHEIAMSGAGATWIFERNYGAYLCLLTWLLCTSECCTFCNNTQWNRLKPTVHMLCEIKAVLILRRRLDIIAVTCKGHSVPICCVNTHK